MSETCAERLAEYTVGLRFRHLPSEVVAQVRRVVLDSIGVAIAGCRKKWAQAVLAEIRRTKGAAQSTIWYYGDRVPDTSAALVNGMFAHSMDFNDDHAGIQVGGIMPTTAIAAGESRGASGRDVITAIALGYDVAIRLADAINSQNLYLRGFQPTAVCGAFAATLVAGKVLGLRAGRLADALGIAGSYAGGTIEFLKDGTDTKRYHVAKAAHGGLLCARLAQGGMTGPHSIFEGDYGLFKVCSADSHPERLLAGLGEKWEVLDTSVKLYPFCDGNAAPLEATLAILRENGLTHADIARLDYRIKTFLVPYCIDYHGDRSRKFRPQNELDAQMSLPYCIAKGLLKNGDLRVSDFDPRRFRDPRVLALADKVDATADSDLDRIPLRPMSMPSICRLTTNDGRVFEKRVDYQKGDPRNPFAPEDFVTKFATCVEGFLDASARDRIVDAVMRLDKLADLGELTAALRSASRSGRARHHARRGTRKR